MIAAPNHNATVQPTNTSQTNRNLPQTIPLRYQLSPGERPVVFGVSALASTLIAAGCSAYGHQNFPENIEKGVGNYTVAAGMFGAPLMALMFGAVAIADFRAFKNGTAAPQFHKDDLVGFQNWWLAQQSRQTT